MRGYRLGFDVLIIPFQAVSFLNGKTKSRANALDFVYSLRACGNAGSFSASGMRSERSLFS